MSRKSKGINAERELVHMFWAQNIPCIRVAGSGSSKYPCPDIILGTPKKKICIECKTSKSKTLYLTKEEISQLNTFSKEFGIDAYIAIKFNKEPWRFYTQSSLKKSDKFYVVSLEQGKKDWLCFQDMVDLILHN